MPIPAADVETIEAYCRHKTADFDPEHSRITLEASGNTATIYDMQRWGDDLGWLRLEVARLRYTATTRLWTLYWADRHGRFHRFDGRPAVKHVKRHLEFIDRDPTNIFWG